MAILELMYRHWLLTTLWLSIGAQAFYLVGREFAQALAVRWRSISALAAVEALLGEGQSQEKGKEKL